MTNHLMISLRSKGKPVLKYKKSPHRWEPN